MNALGVDTVPRDHSAGLPLPPHNVAVREMANVAVSIHEDLLFFACELIIFG